MSGTRAISTTSRRELSSSFFLFLQGKAPKEIHAFVKETLACFLPGRAKDLSAPPLCVFWLNIRVQTRDLSCDNLARPGRKQAWKHVRDARDFNNIETRDVIRFFFSLQGQVPKEIQAILTETLACFIPGRAKYLSAPLCVPPLSRIHCRFGLNIWCLEDRTCVCDFGISVWK